MICTRDNLIQALHRIGLTKGDSLLLHSSFRSMQPFDGDPETVIDAILDVIGSAGNLMLPTFNYTNPIPKPYFDIIDTPCRTGIIPELGRKRSDSVRSLHPTHSVAVIGSDAKELTMKHLECRAFGIGSPIDRLSQHGGKVLLLGVGHTVNSIIHVAEEYVGLPKVEKGNPIPRAKIRLSNGHIIEHEIDSSPSCSTAFEVTAWPLRLHGEISDYRIGSCNTQLMKGQVVIDRVIELLRSRPTALLCNSVDCAMCPGVRRNLSQSDWVS